MFYRKNKKIKKISLSYFILMVSSIQNISKSRYVSNKHSYWLPNRNIT